MTYQPTIPRARRRWGLPFIALFLLLIIGCGDDDASFDIEVESSDGGTSTVSGSFSQVGDDSNQTSAWVTPGVLQVLLDDGTSSIQLTIVTSESHRAPGSFQQGAGLQDLRYVSPDDTHYQLLEGEVIVDTCPNDVHEMATGSLVDIEVITMETEETKTLSGDFSVAITSVQFNGEDDALHCD